RGDRMMGWMAPCTCEATSSDSRDPWTSRGTFSPGGAAEIGQVLLARVSPNEASDDRVRRLLDRERLTPNKLLGADAPHQLLAANGHSPPHIPHQRSWFSCLGVAS